MPGSITLEHGAEGVARLTLANPAKLNAIDIAMWRELQALMLHLQALPPAEAPHAVVVCGAGGHFAAGGDIVDMNEVQPRIDKGRNAAARRIEQDPTCRRRPDVARSDGRRWADDDRGQTITRDHLLDGTLGHGLAALVGTDRLVGRERGRLVDRRRGARDPQGGNAARIDDAFDAGGQRLALEIQGPFDIGAYDLGRIARPQPIVGRDVKQVSDAFQGGLERPPVGEIADDHLAVEAD